MTEGAADALRRAAAHVLVTDVEQPLLDDGASHHLFHVLRIRAGELVTVTDGRGRWRPCRAAAGVVEVTGEIVQVMSAANPVTVAFAIPKADRPEWIVQKLTELGVDRIAVLHAERSIVRWDAERAERHLAKLRRVACEALQQSRGVWLPEITGPLPAADLLPQAVAAEPGGRPLAAGDDTIAIGPEGGWTDAELASARDRVSLATTVLRVETAAVVAGALMVAARRP